MIKEHKVKFKIEIELKAVSEEYVKDIIEKAHNGKISFAELDKITAISKRPLIVTEYSHDSFGHSDHPIIEHTVKIYS